MRARVDPGGSSRRASDDRSTEVEALRVSIPARTALIPEGDAPAVVALLDGAAEGTQRPHRDVQAFGRLRRDLVARAREVRPSVSEVAMAQGKCVRCGAAAGFELEGVQVGSVSNAVSTHLLGFTLFKCAGCGAVLGVFEGGMVAIARRQGFKP